MENSENKPGDPQFTATTTAHCTKCGKSWPMTMPTTGMTHEQQPHCPDCGAHAYYEKKGNLQRGA